MSSLRTLRENSHLAQRLRITNLRTNVPTYDLTNPTDYRAHYQYPAQLIILSYFPTYHRITHDFIYYPK